MRLLAPLFHLPGPGTSTELLAVQDERVRLDPFPTPHYTPDTTSPGKACDDARRAAVSQVQLHLCYQKRIKQQLGTYKANICYLQVSPLIFLNKIHILAAYI